MREAGLPWVAGAVGLVLIVSAGCSGGEASGSTGVPATGDPGEVLKTIEQRLIAADRVSVRTSATASGVVDARIDGEMRLDPVGARLKHDGTFVGNPVDLHLHVEGDVLRGGNGDHRFEVARPPGLRSALVVGMTRMGLLHNLARLSGTMPPDHADGGVADWLGVVDPRWADDVTEDAPSDRAIDFRLTVDGQDAARVRLWIDERSGLPVRRDQTTLFPQGDMNVVETYTDWVVGPAE